MGIWVTILSMVVFGMFIGGWAAFYTLIEKTNRHEQLIAEIRGKMK